MPPFDFAPWLASPAGAGAALAVAFAAGCMAGSFLNVVVHRVPLRETVIFGRSRCPGCRSQIRARDNVPVLGWLLLRGRCRDCGAAISPRYPLVEAACGGLVAAVAAAEFAVATHGDLATAAAAWAGRSLLVLTIVAWSLLAAQGHAVSTTTVRVAAAAAALLAASVGQLAPLPIGCATGCWTACGGWAGCLAASLAGMLTGWATGGAGGRAARAACILIGAAGGWQASLVAAAAAYAARLLERHGGAGALATVATVAAVVCWHPLARAWTVVCRFVWGV